MGNNTPCATVVETSLMYTCVEQTFDWFVQAQPYTSEQELEAERSEGDHVVHSS
jgi:hypothetical protein